VRKIVLILMICCTAFAAHADGKLKVVVSFSILGDMVGQVAGDNVELKVLVGPNGDVHEYDPTPADAKSLANADLVFINGLGLEGWMERLIKSSGYKGQVIVVTKGITPLSSLERGSKAFDPHAWQNIENGKIYVGNITDALALADKINSSQYKNNSKVYLNKLDNLDKWVREEINTVPPTKRKVISTHDAFQYFAHAYGVEFIAPLGVSTESEATAADMAKLIDQIRQQKITAVFFENMTDSRLIKQLEADAGAFVGGTLYSDALSASGGDAPDYMSMFKHNVPLLVAAMIKNPNPNN